MTGKNRLKIVGRTILINLMASFIFTFAIGGNAANGEVIGEQYFVSSHAKLTEVSRELFLLQYWWSTISWLSVGLFMLGALIFKWKE